MRRWGGWLLLAALVAGAVPSWAADGDQKFKSNTRGQFQIIDNNATAAFSTAWFDMGVQGWTAAMVECICNAPGTSTVGFHGLSTTTQPASATDGYLFASNIGGAAVAGVVASATVRQFAACGTTGNSPFANASAGGDVCPRFVKLKVTGNTCVGVSCVLTVYRAAGL